MGRTPHRRDEQSDLPETRRREFPPPAIASPAAGSCRESVTEAAALQRAGIGARAITLSIPTRYIHTVTETINKKDAERAVNLPAAWLCA